MRDLSDGESRLLLIFHVARSGQLLIWAPIYTATHNGAYKN
jgi:hypothetical protein